MSTVPSAGVLGLVATPLGPHPSRSHDAPHVSASLIEWETSPSTSMGVDAQGNAVRAASFLMAAAAFGCLFMGIALVVMAKSLTARYEAGRRGAGWLKVKPVHTLDLVVLAVEWGSGRRRGKLSNIHLGARDPATGGFVMLGKTFKGMTDAMLDWQTVRFTELAVGPTDGYVVQVRPEQVVEVAFDGVQTSPRYPGGVALRFARVLRYRDDKRAQEADTIDTVRAIHRAEARSANA